MPTRPFIRHSVPALLLAVLMASCAAPPKAPPPPPPPPPVPTVSLSPQVVQAASAYRYYMTRSAAITPDFADGDGIARAVQMGAAYEPTQMVRGAIAYAAVVSLQDKAFVDNVRVYARDPAQRREVINELLKNPAYVAGMPDAPSAAGLVIANLGSDSQRLYETGKAVKQSAYDIQKQPWSKADISGREARLAAAKSVSVTAMAGDLAETARLQQSSMALPNASVSAPPASPPYTPTVTRGLAIAALAVLGEARDSDMATISGLMSEPNIGGCMGSAKLNLYQCLAVARPHYEDAFCLGQHALMDTGRCMIRASGLTEPYEARFVPDASSINKGMGKKPPVRKRPARKAT